MLQGTNISQFPTALMEELPSASRRYPRKLKMYLNFTVGSWTNNNWSGQLERDCRMRFLRLFFWLEWIYLGMNKNRYWFLNFKEGSSILDNYFQYWCVPYQTFSEIRRTSEKDWQLGPRFSNFSFFWVSGPPRKAAKGVNTSRSFVESPRMIDSQFCGSPRMFFNNISVSLRQLSILLGDS